MPSPPGLPGGGRSKVHSKPVEAVVSFEVFELVGCNDYRYRSEKSDAHRTTSDFDEHENRV